MASTGSIYSRWLVPSDENANVQISRNPIMSSPIKTVGVIGAGVIGASWTALFLAKGMKVIITDPAPGAEAKLREYLETYCSAVPSSTVAPAACLDNVTFVTDIDPYLGSLDLIQEVSHLA